MAIEYVVLMTVEGEAAPAPPFASAAGAAFAVHLPAADAKANVASLVSALMPGRVLAAGERRLREQTFFAVLARRGFAIHARVPERLRSLLPERASPLEPGAAPSSAAPCLVWIHDEGGGERSLDAPAEIAGRGARCAFVALPSKEGDIARPRFAAVSFSFAVAAAGPLSLLDVLPTLAESRAGGLPLGDGFDLAGHPIPADRVLVAEDWRRGLLAATQGDSTLVAALARGAFPYFLGRLRFQLGLRRTGGADDPVALVARAGGLEPIPVAESGRLDAGRRERLRAALRAHLAGYATSADEEVLGRLRDLGYL
jgi:hypothetical protein